MKIKIVNQYSSACKQYRLDLRLEGIVVFFKIYNLPLIYQHILPTIFFTQRPDNSCQNLQVSSTPLIYMDLMTQQMKIFEPK